MSMLNQMNPIEEFYETSRSDCKIFILDSPDGIKDDIIDIRKSKTGAEPIS